MYLFCLLLYHLYFCAFISDYDSLSPPNSDGLSNCLKLFIEKCTAAVTPALQQATSQNLVFQRPSIDSMENNFSRRHIVYPATERLKADVIALTRDLCQRINKLHPSGSEQSSICKKRKNHLSEVAHTYILSNFYDNIGHRIFFSL